ncbi:MAG: rubrerythrin family protein [Caldimicrobium sp.]|nr:rubrerythrin family protein [Caldimicrobium sp.]MCX7873835.1 rubrerythrin family protein [Caldimicrobium sp.]MDW8094907.1 rubrerythrin family protein [Caldimicrobium sp.]MDW8095147.1 rubrerythrin family protein [Caldimicrobium sp.]
MKEMTKECLKGALAGESQACVKYLIFADKAEEEGYPKIAKLFRAIAYAERVHAENHLKALNGNNTEGNLDIAIKGETFEVEEMYPAYKAVAELQGEKQALRAFHYAIEAEKIHSALFAEAKEAVKMGRDIDIEDIYICPTCGHTAVNKAPERCPICGVPGDKFKRF